MNYFESHVSVMFVGFCSCFAFVCLKLECQFQLLFMQSTKYIRSVLFMSVKRSPLYL